MTIRGLAPLLVAAALVGLPARGAEPVDVTARARELFRRANLVAWCIVPFDARKRGPEDRAAMLERLGFRHFAYDWRPNHVPSFDQEWDALARHGIALDAFWSQPPNLPELLETFRARGLTPCFWIKVRSPPARDDAERVRRAVDELRPTVEAAAAAGCSVALYNHGGWGGEPENMVAICEALGSPAVGIAYNLHHGHDHLPRFAEALAAMRPHLRCLNLNGMTADGEKRGRKILVLGQGDLDVPLCRTICESGYTGPIGIIGHTDDDAEARLQDNLEGLEWIVGELTGQPIPKPVPRTK